MDMKVRVRVWSCMGDAELSPEHTMAPHCLLQIMMTLELTTIQGLRGKVV